MGGGCTGGGWGTFPQVLNGSEQASDSKQDTRVLGINLEAQIYFEDS